MKTILNQCTMIISLFSMMILQFSCSEETGLSDPDNTKLNDEANSGLAIYIAKNNFYIGQEIDFNQINLDTVELKDTPFITYDQIESYDTINHIINLTIDWVVNPDHCFQ